MKLTRRDALLGLTSCGLATWNLSPVVEAAMGRTLRQDASAITPVELPSIDSARLAQRVVGLLQPVAGERAILVHDPTYYPELTERIYWDLSRAGVHPIIPLTFELAETNASRVANPLEAVQALLANEAKSKRREEEVVSMLQSLFEKANIFLWLPARHTWPDLRWERLVAASRVRSIHFHWIAAPDGRSAREIRTLSRMYERAVLDTDYAMLAKEQDRLINALRDRTIRITGPGGTDLRMHVPRNAWFHKNDGDMSPSRSREAKTVRDREMEVPVGALRFIPDVGSVEGRLALRQTPLRSGIAEGVELDFRNGRISRLHAEKNADEFRAEWKNVGGDIDKIGEVVIGTNPLLTPALPSGELPYFGYGAGYLRISLGDNWESGGTNRSPLGRPLWFLLEEANMQAGAKTLIHRGQLVQ